MLTPLRVQLAQDVIKKTITEQNTNLARAEEGVKHLADKRTLAKELREEFRKNKEQVGDPMQIADTMRLR